MFDFFRKNKRSIFALTLVAFIGSMFIGFGAYLWEGALLDTVAVVNERKIPLRRFLQLYHLVVDDMRASGTELTDELINQRKNEVLQDLISEEAFYQYAKKYEITVPDREIAFNIANTEGFRRDDQFDPSLYFFFLRRMNMTANDFEQMQRRHLMGMKVRRFVEKTMLFTEEELADQELLNQKREAIMVEWFRQLQNDTRVRLTRDLTEIFQAPF